MMKNRFFKSTNIEDLKKEYRELAKKYHPDFGGDTRAFQDMQAEFVDLCQRLANVHRKADSQETEQEAKEAASTPEEFMEIINKVINLDGVEIEIIGHWVWLSGNTFVHKENIKNAGFFWSKKHKKWYWNGGTKKSRKHSRMDMNMIKFVHGCTKVKSGHMQARLATA